jgi:hypothetical protein
MHRILRTFLIVFPAVSLLAATLAYSICRTDVVIVQGRVEQAPRHAIVRVQLIFPKQLYGESGDVTVENEKFTLHIPFSTQSHAPMLMGSLGEKCNRRPLTVIVQLMNSDHSKEFDRVSLDIKKDFEMTDPSAYAPRAEIVLGGVH